ncbi:hypothetical protein ILUMI_11946 [Ignelater luminosus]|uniref:Uncharacterized protein n=1 Tax=Ignelater luminosus TaxID=2038154 RepID=A0A8K0CZE8_IGNLU|nr:hypothetical protein ILUMI_11946 [Ignelater luminosus]
MDCYDTSDSDTPPEVVETTNGAISNLLPAKSKGQYEKAYTQFCEWCMMKNVVKVSESVLLAYLEEKSTKVKTYSMDYIFYAESHPEYKGKLDIQRFLKLLPYLKSKSVGYRGKKSKVLTKEDITKFIKEADDERSLLK